MGILLGGVYFILIMINMIHCHPQSRRDNCEHLELEQENMQCQSNLSFRVAISITTIPPRFNYISQSLVSWFYQDLMPAYIFIHVPQRYRRFKQKTRKLSSEMKKLSGPMTYAQKLREVLASNDMLLKLQASSNPSPKVIVHEIERDWGPATKLVGLLQINSNWSISYRDADFLQPPDYWLIADDDVSYAKHTISSYRTAILQMKSPQNFFEKSSLKFAMTHFLSEERLFLHLDKENEPRRVAHVQGVDTILFPSNVLSTSSLHENNDHRYLSSPSIEIIFIFFHGICPESFYQDDYLISLLLNFAGFQVKSIGTHGNNVAGHIEGVSKSNSQMHMHSEVFDREESTKSCITRHANRAYELFQL